MRVKKDECQCLKKKPCNTFIYPKSRAKTMVVSLALIAATMIISLAVLVKSSDKMLDALANYSKCVGVSEYLAGFLILTIGTELPEMASSLSGAQLGAGAIVIGTILGSNFFKMPLMGIGLILRRKMRVDMDSMGNAPLTTFLACALPLFLLLDGNVTTRDGIILLIAYFAYVLLMWQGEREKGTMKKDLPMMCLLPDMVKFWICLVLVLASSIILVFATKILSDQISMSLFWVSFFILGIGSAMPEVSVMIQSVRKRKAAFTLGNNFGAMVTNSLLTIGMVAVISPFSVDPYPVIPTAAAFLLGLLLMFFAIEREEVTWKHGIALVAFFTLYLVLESYIGL